MFEKALAEPNFAPLYAQFCHAITPLLAEYEIDNNGQAETQSFKRLILNQCQAEFEKENKGEPDAGEKKRMLGTIRFIGELFVRRMLSSSIMKYCIDILFGEGEKPVEENIEVWVVGSGGAGEGRVG